MPRLSHLVALLALVPSLSLADVAVPDTSAGRAFSAWLDSFNSPDGQRVEVFVNEHAPWMDLHDTANWRSETGGYDLLDVYYDDAKNIFFRVRARSSAVEEIGRLTLDDSDPVKVAELGTRRVPPGAKLNAAPLDAAMRTRLVDRVASSFDSRYVYPDIGNKMAIAIRRHATRGDYRALLYGEDFARRLTKDLREVSRDRHAEVRFSYVVRTTDPPKTDSEAESRRLAALNCGFDRAERLPSNVGYLKFDMFGDPAVCATTAGAAMTFLADTDALILDLRENNGGRGEMVEFIASYLFAERTHLNDVYKRAENATEQAWTLPFVPGKKFIGTPVLVLTSKRTFSAAESLSYALQNLKRATLVGEPTGGGAHPIEIEQIDEQFSVVVPTARSVSPITNSDWEGKGVQPDVKTPADQALSIAQKIATEEVSRKLRTSR